MTKALYCDVSHTMFEHVMMILKNNFCEVTRGEKGKINAQENNEISMNH